MADYIELRQRSDKTPHGASDSHEVVFKQPGKHDEIKTSTESSEQGHRKRTISDAYERRIKGRKEREKRRLKQLEEDEIRRRERRKKQRLNQAKNIGQKSIYDAESKREKEVNKLNQIDRKDFEREMDKVLADGDLDEITEIITAHKLTKCKTNSLEKSLEVSYKLKKLADTNYPDAEDFIALAHKVEDFSLNLLEPLKSDDMKRAIFEGKDFDRIAEKAVLFRQKKFISHPVVYNLLIKRWTGSFHHLKHKKWADIRSFKWLFLMIWAIFDVILFPFVFTFLYIIHIMVGLTKKECHAIVVMSPFSLDSMEDMQDLASACFAILRPPYTNNICDQDNIKVTNVKQLNDDAEQETSKLSFMDCLKTARKKFKQLEKRQPTEKLLIIMTDDKFDVAFHKLTREAHRIKNDDVRVIAVGFGVHPEIKELETLATKQQNVFLYHGNVKLGEIVQTILEALRGHDIFDRYVQYFNTPYFIFLRDTLSYLTLLGLHFAMCLQPSTLHFTAVEWIIMLFFIGRLLMEIYQAVMEKHLSDKLKKASLDYEKWVNGKANLSTEMLGSSDDEVEEIQQPVAKQRIRRKATICRVFSNIMSSYFSDWWNALDLVTLVVYAVVLILRSITWAEHFTVSNNRLLAVAGYFYGLNTMFLTLRVFGNIMESAKNTGSIQIALFQIIGAVVAIFGQFLAATLAFSLAITKVYVAEMSYTTARNSTAHGFCQTGKGGIECWMGSAKHLLWSLLGDPDLDPLKSSDEPSDVLAHILYGIFLVMAVVMLMNMMIALLSNTYQRVEDNAFYEWSYRRATTIRTYVNYHPVPVPFNIVSFAVMMLRRLYKYVCCSKCCVSDNKYLRKRRQTSDPASFFDCLVFDLQAEYFSKHGYAFPLEESSKMDWVFKETEGNRQLIGHIAKQVFTLDNKETQRLTEDFTGHSQEIWDTRGIDTKGHQLTYVPCDCVECSMLSIEGKTRNHGATFSRPLSQEWQGFEVLIQESVERRVIVIGVVPGDWQSPHVFAGCHGNSAGYYVDEGKIFDTSNQKIGIECEGAMAHRGDLIGCKIQYDSQSRDGTLPVTFTLNGRVIGEANVEGKREVNGEWKTNDLFPYIGIGWEGISLLFKMSSTNRHEDSSFEKDQFKQLLTRIGDKVDSLQQYYEETMTNLERKVDFLNERCTCKQYKHAQSVATSTTEEKEESSIVDIAL